MRATYDPSADAAYVAFRPIGAGEAVENVVIGRPGWETSSWTSTRLAPCSASRLSEPSHWRRPNYWPRPSNFDPATKGALVLGPSVTRPPFLVLDVVGRPASYSSAAEAPWKAAVRAAVTTAGEPVRDCRFAVSIAFCTPVAANANEVWDLDNLIKPTLDAMEGVFGARPWRGRPQAADDRVDCLWASKRTATAGEQPGAHIEVFEL